MNKYINDSYETEILSTAPDMENEEHLNVLNPAWPCNPDHQNILIVDDSVSMVNLITEALKHDYNVRAASCGEDALELMNVYVPDLLILDIIMPGINGYELCRSIRADKRFGSVKILMISGETQLRDRLKGFEAGADDYITKPIEIMELTAKVKVSMRLKEYEDKLRIINDNLNKQVEIRSQQLVETEKLTAIGQHTAGIVHNLNTPLQALLGCAELLKMDYPENEHIDIIIRAAECLKDMTRTILMSSGKERNPNAVSIDFNKIITDQLELMKMDPFFKGSIETKLKLQTIPLYTGVYSHFSQILGNLIKNAAEAMYDSKERILEISTCSYDGIICITISDTGCGIEKENLEKIFDPFFTSKPLMASDGRPTGTGLGLASAREMIESYQGKIMVSSTPGEGSMFKVYLPVREYSRISPEIDPNLILSAGS